MDKRPQDHGYVVQAIPVRRGVVRRGLHPENNRGGEEIQGVVAGAGGMTGVREVVGKGVTGDAPPNPARRGERGVGIRWQQGRRGRRALNLQIGLSCEGMT